MQIFLVLEAGAMTPWIILSSFVVVAAIIAVSISIRRYHSLAHGLPRQIHDERSEVQARATRRMPLLAVIGGLTVIGSAGLFAAGEMRRPTVNPMPGRTR